MDSIWLLLLLQIFLIALNAIFASAEIAVLSISEAKLERMANDGNGKAKRLFRLTREPARFLATIQVAITLSGFLGSAFAADNFSEPLVEWVINMGVNIPRATLDTIAVVLITLILSYFTLVFGELVPKRLAMKKSEKVALGISGLVSGIATLFRPIVFFLSVSTNVVLRLLGIDPNEAEDQVSEEEIRMMVDAGSEKGTIDTHEKEFIQNVFEFNDITAGEIAIHRTDVALLWLEDDVDVWAHTIFEARHTLYPVCDGSADNVIGILNAKDYFPLKEKTRKNILAAAVHPAFFVPETVKADVLFRNMKKSRNSMAVVLDEYGGMVGIVTLQDLVEELVGDLNDDIPDLDNPEPYIEKTGECSWEIHGNIALELLEAATGLELATEEYDTFTGMVFDALGAVPGDGEQEISLELENLWVRILKIEAHQIEAATVTLKAKESAETAE
ncbi:MAG: HlyC/CorC family transporter [Oscillospiraceae bacterium]|nr:HlyC/CorC family transporter [Oscillospiraceae bacterium]